MEQAQNVTIVLIDQFPSLALSCTLAPLALANRNRGQKLYDWRLASMNGRDATAANGQAFAVSRGFEAMPADSLLLVLSGTRVERLATSQHIDYLRRENRRGTRIAALCSGAYVLARAGLLAGVRVAVSAGLHETFATLFPEVPVAAEALVLDQRYDSAASAKAALDLMLAHVGARHGAALAERVADEIVECGVRGVATGEVSFAEDRGRQGNPHVAAAIRAMAESEPASAPTAAEIAAGIGISQRQLERLFKDSLNRTPKRYFTYLRLSKARDLLLQSAAPISEIARACGFASAASFARAYHREFGARPNVERSRRDGALSD